MTISRKSMAASAALVLLLVAWGLCSALGRDDPAHLPDDPAPAGVPVAETTEQWVRHLQEHEGNELILRRTVPSQREAAHEVDDTAGARIKGLGVLRPEEVVAARQVLEGLAASRAKRLLRDRAAAEKTADGEVQLALATSLVRDQEVQAALQSLAAGSYHLEADARHVPDVEGLRGITFGVMRDGAQLSLTVVIEVARFRALAEAIEYRRTVEAHVLDTACRDFNGRDHSWRQAMVSRYAQALAKGEAMTPDLAKYFRSGIVVDRAACMLRLAAAGR